MQTFEELIEKIDKDIIRSATEYWNRQFSKLELISCLEERRRSYYEAFDLVDGMISDSIENYKRYRQRFDCKSSSGVWSRRMPEDCRAVLVTLAQDAAVACGIEYDFQSRYATEIAKLKRLRFTDPVDTGEKTPEQCPFSEYDYATPIDALTPQERNEFYRHFLLEVPDE